MRPSNQRLRACGLLVGAMVLVFSPFRPAWASEPAQLTTPTGNVAANVGANVSGSAHSPLAAGVRGRDLISYLSIADLLRQTGFGAARAPHPMCAEAPQTSARVDLHSVRCTIPPGGLGPVTGPILTPATPKAPDTPAPVPAEPNAPAPASPPTPANANEPGKAANPPQQALDPGFRYNPPGVLADRDATASRGRNDDRKVYVPDMLFPIRLEPGRFAAMNSQIWGYGGGGYNGVGEAGGTECDPRNYDPMHQRDNFCEVRGWSMPLCPSGAGHQGQDIRPPSCKDNAWEVVAVVDGIITLVTSNTTVKLKGNDGTVYEYLHMHPNSITVTEGSKVKQGDVVGRVSKYMAGTRSTTYHLHFNVRQRIQVGNKVLEVYVPPYTSLIAAYRRSKGIDSGIDAMGDLAPDPMLEIGAVAQAPPQPAPTPSDPQPTPAPTPPAPAPVDPAPTPATPPAPAPAPAEPTPSPAPTAPAPEPPAPPSPAPPSPPPPSAPEPPPPPAPTPAPPAPAPDPTPPPSAPAPTPPAPTPPAPTPAPPPPAPTPPPVPEPQKSWWQRGVDKATELWNRWWK